MTSFRHWHLTVSRCGLLTSGKLPPCMENHSICSRASESWYTACFLHPKHALPTFSLSDLGSFTDGFPDFSLSLFLISNSGWGRSVATPKDRGRTGPTALVLADMHSFLVSVAAAATTDNVPLFLMGHSMGGAQVLYYILHADSPFNVAEASRCPRLSGVMASSPLIALHPSSRPGAFTVTMGRLAGRMLPNFQRHTALDPKLMSRDERVCADWAADELCHDTGTLEGLAGMLDRGIWLESLSGSDETEISRLRSADLPPVWLGHGTGDLVTDYAASERFAATLGSKIATFQPYPGGYHKLHADTPDVKQKFASDVAHWILGKCVSSRADQTQSDSAAVQRVESADDGKLEQHDGDSIGKTKL